MESKWNSLLLNCFEVIYCYSSNMKIFFFLIGFGVRDGSFLTFDICLKTRLCFVCTMSSYHKRSSWLARPLSVSLANTRLFLIVYLLVINATELHIFQENRNSYGMQFHILMDLPIRGYLLLPFKCFLSYFPPFIPAYSALFKCE